MAAFDAPGPRVTKAMPGRPVNLPRFGHVGGAALVAADDQAQRFAGVVERVENGEIALARYAEGEVDPLTEQIGDQNLATGARLAH